MEDTVIRFDALYINAHYGNNGNIYVAIIELSSMISTTLLSYFQKLYEKL